MNALEDITSRIRSKEHKSVSHSPCVTINDLSFRYPSAERNTLEKISLTIGSGEYVALLGPNGGGKTTLLKAITGLVKPDSGSIELCCSDEHSARAHIGYVPQSSGSSHRSFPATVLEVVLSGRVVRRGLFKPLGQEDKQASLDALRVVGLSTYTNRLITDLSGGERQKVFIARALAGQPTILILDEPTTDIDSNSREEFYKLLKGLNRDLNLTVILVSHDIETVAGQAERIIYLDNQILFDGHTKDFTEQKIHQHA